MENQLPMPYPSDEPDATECEYINLDTMPDEALASLVEIELPNLTPRFGLPHDIALGVNGPPEAPVCAPPPGMDALTPDERLHWHQTWERILQVMGDPVQVFPWRGNKRVIHVLRSWVLVVWADGRITPLRWRTWSCGLLRLVPADAELNLARLASGDEWLAVVCEGMKWELVRAYQQWGHPETAPEPRTKTQQMFAAFRAPLLEKVRRLRLDSRIHARLGLDTQVMTDAQAAYGLKHHARANEVTITSYNWVLSQFLELETLRREAPHLLPFYPLVAEEVSLRKGYELTYQIKRRVTRQVGSAGWKLMLRHGRRLFVDVRERYGFNDEASWLDLLQLHSLLFGGCEPAPDALLDMVMRQFGNPYSPRKSYFTPVQKSLQAWAHFGDLWRKAPPADAQELDHWALVAGWIADPMGPARFDSRQRTLGFEHLVKKARAWERNRSAWVSTHNELLPVWHGPVGDRRWEVRFLKDRAAFWKEGTDMGHCLGRRGGPTLGIDKLFGSVYFEGQHIGTALYAGHDDRWALSEAHGKFNQPLAAQALRALRKLAGHIRLPVYRRAVRP